MKKYLFAHGLQQLEKIFCQIDILLTVFKPDNKIMNLKYLNMMKCILSSTIIIIIIDEVSMIVSNYLKLLDERLKLIYDPIQNFSIIYTLLSSDFLQMPSLDGIDLCKVLHVRKTILKVNLVAYSLISNFFK